MNVKKKSLGFIRDASSRPLARERRHLFLKCCFCGLCLFLFTLSGGVPLYSLFPTPLMRELRHHIFLVAGWANSHADLGLAALNVELRYRDVDHAARQIASASAAADAVSEHAAESPEGIAGKALPRRVAHRNTSASTREIRIRS